MVLPKAAASRGFGYPDLEVFNWGTAASSAPARGFSVAFPGANLRVESFPHDWGINPNSKYGLHALPGLARHTLTLALHPSTQPRCTSRSTTFLFLKPPYCLSSCFPSALIHFAHLLPHWQTPVLPGDPSQVFRMKTPPTRPSSAPEHPLCDGRSGHAVSISSTRPALSAGRVPVGASVNPE